MVDDAAVMALAQQIYAERAAAEKRAHAQGIVPWDQLGGSYQASIVRMARERLESAEPAADA